jgi:uncharacterized membrane protein YeiH
MEDTGKKDTPGFGQRVIQAGRPLAIAAGLFVIAALWVLAWRGADVTKAVDLDGVFCFAYVAACGTWKAVRHQSNAAIKILVVGMAALLTGCGGGALLKNPILYGHLVPYPIEQPEYLAAVVAAVLLSTLDFEMRVERHADIAAAADAIAHALFTFTAAQTAIETFGPAGVGVIGAIFAGFASAAGGGIIRDVILDWITGHFRGVFVTICTPYRWASLFSAVVVVALMLTVPTWAWAGAALSGLLVYTGRNLTLAKAE